jgi:chemotaxis regulatin CheY-phosphate phosphatase CheZ
MDSYKFPDAESKNDTSETDTDFEVEIVSDVPEKDRGRKPLDRDVADPSDEELNTYSEGVKKRIKELTHARHDERRAKETTLREKQELERVAQVLIEENRKLKQQYSEGAKQYAETETSAAAMVLENARSKLKAAHEAFDTDAIIQAQEELSDARMRLQQAQYIKNNALQNVENTVQTSQPVRQEQQIDEKTLRWQAKNQWFGAVGQEDMTSLALGLHQKLVNSGVDPRSDDYFEHIDARMRSAFPDFFGSTERTEGSKRPATVVAHGTRSAGVKKVQLTETQVALARKFKLTPQQYAAEIVKISKAEK